MPYKTKFIHPYTLTYRDIERVVLKDMEHGSVQLLPQVSQIPESFWARNQYTRMVENILVMNSARKNSTERIQARDRLTNTSFVIKSNFSAIEIRKSILSHLTPVSDIELPYGYRVAAVGYMLSKMIHIVEEPMWASTIYKE